MKTFRREQCNTRFTSSPVFVKACVWYGNHGKPPFSKPYNDGPIVARIVYCGDNMKNILIVVTFFLSLVLSGCVSETDAEKALSAHGFTDIEILGYSVFGCSEDEFNHTKFRATNPQGVVVEGVVCSGILFKNSTIRF